MLGFKISMAYGPLHDGVLELVLIIAPLIFSCTSSVHSYEKQYARFQHTGIGPYYAPFFFSCTIYIFTPKVNNSGDFSWVI